MGRIIAGLGSPHAPSIGAVIDKGGWAGPGWHKSLHPGFVQLIYEDTDHV